MKRAIIVFAVCVCGCQYDSAATQVESGTNSNSNQATAESLGLRFQAILDAAVAEGLMAVSVHISWDDGSWMGVGGETSADSGESLSPDSLFRIASITKLFTTTVILQLVDENVLDLSNVLTDYLPESPVAEIPNAEAITLGMLLDHTSGIRSFTDIDSFWHEAYDEAGLDRIWEPAALVRYGLKKKPHFDPGARGRKQYSNSNYILLGMIIEKVTGETLATAYGKRIYEPLGLNHTFLEGFESGLNNVQHSFMKTRGIIAKRRGWSKPDSDDLYDVSSHYKLYNSWAWSAGGLSSTSGDLNRFLTGVRDGSLLSDSGQDVLFRNNSAEGNAGVVFGGSGGWDGITTSAYVINDEIRIVVLANSTGLNVNADTLRGQLYRVLKPQV